jgi:hypothetical protein
LLERFAPRTLIGIFVQSRQRRFSRSVLRVFFRFFSDFFYRSRNIVARRLHEQFDLTGFALNQQA